MTIHDTIADIKTLLADEQRMIDLYRNWQNPLTGTRSGIAVMDDIIAREWQKLDNTKDSRASEAMDALPAILDRLERLEAVAEAVRSSK